jgi:hypothetical protein
MIGSSSTISTSPGMGWGDMASMVSPTNALKSRSEPSPGPHPTLAQKKRSGRFPI